MPFPMQPLRGLPRQDQIWAWTSFDVANQSFTLIINTLLFNIFFQQQAVPGVKNDNTWWSIVVAVSSALVVVCTPLAGAIADQKAWKKAMLLGSGLCCAALTCCFGLIPRDGLWIAVLLYVPANFAFAIGESFLAAFLPEVARRQDIGRVSGFSWLLGYVAALLLLVVCAFAIKVFQWKGSENWRPLFVFAGVWFFALMAPTLVLLRERAVPEKLAGSRPAPSLFTLGVRRLAATVRDAGRYRQLAVYLAAFLVFGIGMQVVIFFASVLAAEFGFTDEQLVYFVFVITISGGVGIAVPMYLQDRVGHKRMTIIILSFWIFTTAGFALYSFLRARSPDPAAFPTWPLWLIGNLIGFGLGSLGTASRAFVGYLTPAHKTAEFFGLWGVVSRLSAVCFIPFAVVKDRLGTTESLVLLAGFFLAGGIILLFVDEKAGYQAALEAERLHAHEVEPSDDAAAATRPGVPA